MVQRLQNQNIDAEILAELMPPMRFDCEYIGDSGWVAHLDGEVK